MYEIFRAEIVTYKRNQVDLLVMPGSDGKPFRSNDTLLIDRGEIKREEI